jgi:hypothetical protein
LRRVAVLIRGLPADAATVKALAPEAEWDAAGYLLAAILEQVQHANWLTVEINKRKGARNPRPVPLRRPGDPVKRQPRRLDGAQLAEWLGEVAK